MKKEFINTDQAPAAIGTYSQAVKAGDMVYLSGQIPLDPASMEVVSDDFQEQTHQVFKNLLAVTKASGGDLNDIIKFNVYLTDLNHFSIVNDVMMQYLKEPYPARAAVEISALPKGVQIEVEAVMYLPEK